MAEAAWFAGGAWGSTLSALYGPPPCNPPVPIENQAERGSTAADAAANHPHVGCDGVETVPARCAAHERAAAGQGRNRRQYNREYMRLWRQRNRERYREYNRTYQRKTTLRRRLSREAQAEKECSYRCGRRAVGTIERVDPRTWQTYRVPYCGYC